MQSNDFTAIFFSFRTLATGVRLIFPPFGIEVKITVEKFYRKKT